jgi:hypothetical protein
VFPLAATDFTQMKKWHRHHILSAADSLGLAIGELATSDADRIRASVNAKYASGVVKPLWERLTGAVACPGTDGWKDICAFVGGHEAVLFFDAGNDTSMFAIPNGECLRKILADCPLFVFYVTDRACSFLLCHNDHDYVLGTGEAANWVSAVRQRYSNDPDN